MLKLNGVLALGVAALVVVAACADDPSSSDDELVLLSVEPAGGSADVNPDASVVVTFDHELLPQMTQYAALHEGAVTGAVVDGSWTLSEDGRTLTFSPAAPLKPATSYTIHLGGGMHGAEGEPVNYDMHGPHMGGHMMTGNMHDNHMGGDHPHMGEGWQHVDGSHGMTFSFTTSG